MSATRLIRKRYVAKYALFQPLQCLIHMIRKTMEIANYTRECDQSQCHKLQHRKTLQHIATHCNALPYTATHCHTLQYTHHPHTVPQL